MLRQLGLNKKLFLWDFISLETTLFPKFPLGTGYKKAPV
jgi:hypothetical protein